MSNPLRATRLVPVLCALLLGSAPSGAASPEAAPVRLKARTFVPGASLEIGGRAGNRVHRLLQFATLPGREERAALAAAGIRLLEYVPERTYVASLPGGFPTDHPVLRGVRFAGPLLAADKIAPRLAVGAPVPGAVSVAFHRDVTPADGVALLRAAGFAASVAADGSVVVDRAGADLASLGAIDAVIAIAPPRGRLETHNDGVRAAVDVAPLYQSPYGLDGSSARLGQWDGTVADGGHPDLLGRLTAGSGQNAPSDCDADPECLHASHVLGTAIGDGTASGGQYQGMAPGVSAFGYDFDGNIASGASSEVADAIEVYDIDQTQNSWGYCVGSGGCAPCSRFGEYEGLARDQDAVVHGDLGKALTVVFSCGNYRNDAGSGCTQNQTWENITPPATAKNVIAVGAVNSDDLSMTVFSSWGPTDDGRLKPDLVAPGCEGARLDTDPDRTIWSVLGGTGDYAGNCGTSMAAPVVSGAVSLLIDDVVGRTGSYPPPRTVRAALFHTATDLTSATGSAPGPDYATGWGLVQARDAVDRLRTDGVVSGAVGTGDEEAFPVDVPPGTTQLRATLVWDDPPASLLADPALVNDLDLVVLSPSGARAYPWTLDPGNPADPATRDAEDHRNPTEQVLVDSPESGLWSIVVRGTAVPMGGDETFTLIVDPPADVEDFGLESPDDGVLYYPDSPPATFTWARGAQSSFKAEFARTPSFGKPKKTSGKTWLTGTSYTPSPDAWVKILKLGKTVPTLYWHVRAKDAAGAKSESESRSFQVAAAQAAAVTAPADGADVPSGAPPTITWSTNHNREYKIIFSTKPSLGKPRATSGKGYRLSGGSWTVDTAVWNKIVTKLAPKTADGTIYYALFSRDALKRKTQDPVRTLRVVP